MTTLDFPTSPVSNQTVVFAGITWQWNGHGWARVGRGTTDHYAYQIAYGYLCYTLSVDPVQIHHT